MLEEDRKEEQNWIDYYEPSLAQSAEHLKYVTDLTESSPTAGKSDRGGKIKFP